MRARPTISPAAQGGAATVLVAIAVLLGLFGMHGLEIGHGVGGSAEMCVAALPILLLSLLVGARTARRSKRLRSAAAPSTDPVAMWGSPPCTRHTSLRQLCVLRT